LTTKQLGVTEARAFRKAFCTGVAGETLHPECGSVGVWPARCGRPSGRTHPALGHPLFFCRRSVDFKKVPYASLRRRLDVPTFAIVPCATDRKRFIVEPVFPPFCPHFLILPTFVTRSLKNFKASARGIRLKPQIAGFGSQRMCPSCGFITSRSKAFCLECGKSFPAVHLW